MKDKFHQIYRNSIDNPEDFWQKNSEDIFWFKKPSKILNKSNHPFYKWYEDGITNTCYNALDIHIDNGKGDKFGCFNISTSYHIVVANLSTLAVRPTGRVKI